MSMPEHVADQVYSAVVSAAPIVIMMTSMWTAICVGALGARIFLQIWDRNRFYLEDGVMLAAMVRLVNLSAQNLSFDLLSTVFAVAVWSRRTTCVNGDISLGISGHMPGVPPSWVALGTGIDIYGPRARLPDTHQQMGVDCNSSRQPVLRPSADLHHHFSHPPLQARKQAMAEILPGGV